MMKSATLERETMWLGGDERAAQAIAMENDGDDTASVVQERAVQAQSQKDHPE